MFFPSKTLPTLDGNLDQDFPTLFKESFFFNRGIGSPRDTPPGLVGLTPGASSGSTGHRDRVNLLRNSVGIGNVITLGLDRSIFTPSSVGAPSVYTNISPRDSPG